MAKLAWHVYSNGTWWPVENEAQLQAWVREGRIGAETPTRNNAMPTPVPLGQLPEFGYLFGRAPPPMTNGPVKTSPRSFVFLTGMIIFGVIVYWGRDSGMVGVWSMVIASIATIVALFGKHVRGTPKAVKHLGAWLTRRPSLFVFSCVVLGTGGLVARSCNASRVEACTNAAQRFSSHELSRSSSRGALRELEGLAAGTTAARETCLSVGMVAEAHQLAAVQELLSAERPEMSRKAEEEVQLEREAVAVATFSTKVPEIKAGLSDAAKQASSQSWLESDKSLLAVQTAVDTFKGTSIEKNAQWKSLEKQLVAQRARIQPQLDTIARRGPMPGFVNGCCRECIRYLRSVANDRDSVDCVQSTIPQIEGPSWTTTTTFRAKNAFGATVLNRRKFFLQSDEVVDMK